MEHETTSYKIGTIGHHVQDQFKYHSKAKPFDVRTVKNKRLFLVTPITEIWTDEVLNFVSSTKHLHKTMYAVLLCVSGLIGENEGDLWDPSLLSDAMKAKPNIVAKQGQQHHGSMGFDFAFGIKGGYSAVDKNGHSYNRYSLRK